MSAASQAGGAPGGGGGGDTEPEYEIRNDDGFVFKVRRGLYPDAAPSTTQPAAGPDPKAAGLRRRRRALLRLRDKRLRDLSRWEALAAELVAPPPVPQPPASPPASSSAPDAAAASSSTSILDELLVQVDLHTELMKKARQWCDEANAVCDAREAAIFNSIATLPLFGRSPSELMEALCSPAPSGDLDEQNGHSESSEVYSAAVKKIPPLPLMGCNPSELMAGDLDEQNGHPESSGVSSAAAKKIPPLPSELMAGLCSPAASGNLDEQSGRPEASGVSSVATNKKQKTGHDLPPILTESRKKASGSTSTAPGTPGSARRKPKSLCTFTAPGTPGSVRRKPKSTPARPPFIVGTPGALTRRRAAAKNESPGDS